MSDYQIGIWIGSTITSIVWIILWIWRWWVRKKEANKTVDLICNIKTEINKTRESLKAGMKELIEKYPSKRKDGE